MRWCAVLVAVLLAGCGAAAFTVPPDRRPTLTTPPELRANGVSGTPFSYCWQSECVDGGVNPAKPEPYPDARAPITFEPAQPLSSIKVHVEMPARDQVAVPVEGADPDGLPIEGKRLTISALPGGDWRVLLVSVGFMGGGDAAYVWELPTVRASP